jgi:soluble lytic murein transglycosylase-like protein
MHHYSATIIIIAYLSFSNAAKADEIFVFKNGKGHTTFTDNKLLEKTCINIYSYSRPQANHNCSNIKARATKLKPLFERYSQEIGFDSKLAMAVGFTESSFDTKAVSKVGAQGVMQLMPTTAKQLGVGNSFRARQNIKGGINYLKKMYVLFNGNIKKTLAAYNA